jgi:hypothetical protein
MAPTVRRSTFPDFQSMSDKIVDLDPNILACFVISSADSSVLGESIRAQHRQELAGLDQATQGMVVKWVLLMFNLAKRFDSYRSKTQFLMIGRERFKGMIFPMPKSDEIIFALTIRREAEATGIYDKIIDFLKSLTYT